MRQKQEAPEPWRSEWQRADDIWRAVLRIWDYDGAEIAPEPAAGFIEKGPMHRVWADVA